jgi:hypothetical protein
MRIVRAAFLFCLTAVSAFAQDGPEIVIPGKPGVPVYINGIDASWGVVEGDFGLDRPNEANPTVVWRPYVDRVPYWVPNYSPRDGRRPRYGRLEIAPPPNRPLPPPAQPYYRSWSTSPEPGPVTQYSSYGPVFVSPSVGFNQGHGGQGPKHPDGHPDGHNGEGYGGH